MGRDLAGIARACRVLQQASTREDLVGRLAGEACALPGVRAARVRLGRGDAEVVARASAPGAAEGDADALEGCGQDNLQRFTLTGAKANAVGELTVLIDPGATINEATRAVLAMLCDAAAGTARAVRAEAEADATKSTRRRWMDRATQGICLIGPDGRVKIANAPLARLLGWERAAMLGRHWLNFLADPDIDDVHATWLALQRGEAYQREIAMKHRDGSVVTVSLAATPVLDDDGVMTGALGMITDITNIRLAEREARKAQAQLSRVLDGLSDAFYAVDRNWRIIDLNRQAERVISRKRSDIVGQAMAVAFPELAGTTFQTALEAAAETGTKRSVVDRYEPFAGWFEMDVYPHADGVSVFVRDVSEKVDAQQRLVKQQSALEQALASREQIIAASLDLICVFGADGRFMEINERSTDILGWRPDEMIGKHHLDLLVDEDVEATKRETRQFLSGQPLNDFVNRWRRKDGRIVHLSWTGRWSPESGRVDLIGRDVTHRIELERQLQQAQRLEAIGQLTGGIAHDFNNLLTVIIGANETIAECAADDPVLGPLATVAMEAAERGAELTGRLLAFSRRQSLRPVPTDLGDQILALEPLLARTLGETVRLRRSLHEGPRTVLVDPTQFEAAVLNLAVNARDAMPDGGTLTFDIRHAVLPDEYPLPDADLPPGGYVILTASDTGAGMTADVMKRAIEPFFTTKEVGHGSGLGLSMVYGFVKQSGGHLAITSACGEGSSFALYFPAYLSKGQVNDQVSATGRVAGSAYVLLVEDEELVRLQSARRLEELGFVVRTAANGPDALALLHQGIPFDVLFTDVVMPRGMNGVQLAEAARTLRPSLKVLFTTGYAEQQAAILATPSPGTDLIGKPYRISDVAARLTALCTRDRA